MPEGVCSSPIFDKPKIDRIAPNSHFTGHHQIVLPEGSYWCS